MNDRVERLASGGAEPTARGFGAWMAGRARRREYWMWVAPLFVSTVVVSVFAPTAAMLVSLPMLFIMIRRLHDLGFSGWFAPLINVAVNIIGFIDSLALSTGGIVGALAWIAALIALGALPGQRKPNEYGPPPGRPKEVDLAETFG